MNLLIIEDTPFLLLQRLRIARYGVAGHNHDNHGHNSNASSYVCHVQCNSVGYLHGRRAGILSIAGYLAFQSFTPWTNLAGCCGRFQPTVALAEGLVDVI